MVELELQVPSPIPFSKMGKRTSRTGQYGFYLTFEQLGFVVGSFIGGLLYVRSVESVFITTTILLLLLAVLSRFRIRRATFED